MYYFYYMNNKEGRKKNDWTNSRMIQNNTNNIMMLYCNKQKIDIGFISKIITDGFSMITTKYTMESTTTTTTTTMQPTEHFDPTIDNIYHSTTKQTTKTVL